MTNILCIETGTDTCSVALTAGGELVALRESRGERDHAARVAVYTEEVLAETGLAASDLSAVAVSKGPGSYTGLRIGVSFAKGLCYGLGIPLVGVGSLDSLCALARSNHSASLFIPMIDARRMEVYGQVFDTDGTALTEPEALIIDESSLARYRDRDVYIFGSGAAKCREALPWAHYIEVEPSARGMIALARAAFETKNFEDTAYFEPFYLKDFVITTSKKKLF
jgi:tRNA threonylcarbamoyladenosine biosynthesis protein TsaB